MPFGLSPTPQNPRALKAAQSLHMLTNPGASALAAGAADRAYDRQAVAELPYTRQFADQTLSADVGRSIRETDQRAQADLDRDLALDDQFAADYDMEFRAPRRQALVNRAKDVDSEATAARAFGPAAKALYERTRRDTTQDAQTRYLQPALIGAQADLDVADRNAAARIGAAEISGAASQQGQARAALLRGLLSRMKEGDPAIMRLFTELLGSQQAAQPR